MRSQLVYLEVSVWESNVILHVAYSIIIVLAAVKVPEIRCGGGSRHVKGFKCTA